jgi:anti-sigma regulatory factor (Ser/Thr protein kinase)
MITKYRYPLIFDRIIRSTKTESDNLICEALQFLEALHYQGIATNVSEFNFRLALDEAVVNAVHHGNCSDPEKRVSVIINAYKKKIKITVTDEGNGFYPYDIPKPTDKKNQFAVHGRGIHLIKNICRVRWNTTGNRVSIELHN